MNKKDPVSKHELYIGLDIGGTKCAVVLGDGSFKIIKKISFDTSVARGYREILSDFSRNIRLLTDEYGVDKIKRIGISCGGPLDSKRGMIYSPPNLPGWESVPVTKYFYDEFGIVTVIQNDANACALAEWLMGAGKGYSNMIFLTFGTGMGSGLIMNGRLYSGTNDMGGEVGHIRLEETGPVGYGKAGSFEGFCSGGGIAQLAKKIISDKLDNKQPVKFCPSIEMLDKVDARTVAFAAREGDPVAAEIINISAEYLGKGLAILVDILNPECIVIGSIYARNEMLFRPVMDKTLKKESIRQAYEVCTVKPALLGDSIGDYAALCVAIYEDKF